MKYLSIDIGGTSIKGGIFEENILLDTFSYLTHGKEGREKILESLDVVISHFLSEFKDIKGIGVSSAGNIDPKSGIVVYASDNLRGFTGLNLKEYIENKYKIETKVNNDAVCFLLSNINKDNFNKNIFMITLGTGVGACLYKNQEIFYGNEFDLGKFAHKVIKENGILCDCKKKGCAEKEVSSAYLLHAIKENYKEDLSIKELFDLYRNKENRAIKILDEYFMKLNDFIKYIETLGVDEIYISGGIATSKDVFIKNIQNKKVKYSELGSLGALYGANYLIRGKKYD